MPVRMSDAFSATATEESPDEQIRKFKTKTGGIRMGDAASLEMVPTSFNEGIFQLSPEEVKSLEDKGAIGWREQWQRQDKTETFIPFNPEAGFKAMILMGAMRRLGSEDDPDIEGEGNQRQRDIDLAIQSLEMWEEERIRGHTIGAQVLKGVTYMPAFMIEFILTGGLATLGKKAVMKTAQFAAKEIAKKSAFKFTTKAVGLGVGASLRTAAMPHNVIEGFANRQVRGQLELTDKGIKIMGESNEKPVTSAVKSFGDVWIENFSEVLGGPSRQIASKFIPKGLRKNFERMFKTLNPDKRTADLWTRVGFDGFLEEMGEERIGAFMRAVTGVDDFGAENPASIIDRVISSIPNGEQLLVEALVLSVPGVLRMGTSQTLEMLSKRGVKTDTRTLNELSQDLLDEIKQIGEEEVKTEVVEIKSEVDFTGQVLADAFSGKDAFKLGVLSIQGKLFDVFLVDNPKFFMRLRFRLKDRTGREEIDIPFMGGPPGDIFGDPVPNLATVKETIEANLGLLQGQISTEGPIDIEISKEIEQERRIEEAEERLTELEEKAKLTETEQEELRAAPFRIRALKKQKPPFEKKKRKTKAEIAKREAEIFERNRLLRAQEKGLPAQLAQRTQEILADVGQGLDKALGVISTRIGNINPKLRDRLRRFEFDLATQIEQDKRQILPFIEGMNRMTKEDQVDMDFALKNGNVKVRERLLEQYGLQEQFTEVRKALDAIYKRARTSGMRVEYLEEMVPRAIKDLRGMVEFFTENDIDTDISYGLRLVESDVLNTFTDNQKAELLNTLIRGKKVSTISLAKPGQLEDRTIETLTPELNQFYFKSDAALLQYFFAVNSAVEANRFFGRGKNENGKNIEDSIGAFVLDLIQKGEISLQQEKILTDILKARFNQKGTHGIVTTFKNISYIDILGSPIKALTQLGDLFIAAHKNGFFNTLGAIFNTEGLTIKKEDLGITQIGVEFEEGRLSHVAVKKIFDLVGFTAIDSFGKNTVIRGSFLKHQKQAQEGQENFISEMERIFETEADQVIEDFKNGTMSTNVKFILASDLMDVQPVSLSEMPEAYNSGGNLRILYMLKSFTIKLLDLFRNDVYNNLRTNPKLAAANFISLSLALMMSGAGPDFLKDWILGREIDIPDTIVDNILKIVGFNKFLVGNTARRGPRSTLMEMIFPPMRFVDSAFKDARTVLKDGFQPDQWETINGIPIAGELYYWWFGRGRTKVRNRGKKKGRVSSTAP